MSESCAPTSEEESSDDDCEECSENLSCDEKPGVKLENLNENDSNEMEGFNIKTLFEVKIVKDTESTCEDKCESSVNRTSSVESLSYLFEIRVDETDSDRESECVSGCDNESVGEGESDCDNHSDCESENDCNSDCESGCNGESSSGCCSESDCDSNCESDCENEGESVTDNVVLYRFNEECKECVLSEINKANFAKWFDGKTVKKRESVVDSDDEC